MFETVAPEAFVPRTRRVFYETLPVSIAVHVVAAGAMLASMIWNVVLPTQSPKRNPSDYTPELSRRSRGVDVWAAMRSLGRSGLEELIERNCRQARRFAEGLQAAGFTVLNDVVLNQVLVQFGDAQRTKRMIAAIQDDGTMWAGETVWQGKTAMRISVCCWATTDADVEQCLAAITKISGRTP